MTNSESAYQLGTFRLIQVGLVAKGDRVVASFTERVSNLRLRDVGVIELERRERFRGALAGFFGRFL